MVFLMESLLPGRTSAAFDVGRSVLGVQRSSGLFDPRHRIRIKIKIRITSKRDARGRSFSSGTADAVVPSTQTRVASQPHMYIVRLLNP